MNPDGVPPEEELAWLTAAYDEALAAGATPTLPPEVVHVLQGAGDCLRLLEEVWPRGSQRVAPPAAVTTPEQLGRFRIVRELGRGGCGVVFLAVDPVLNRKVALKVPHPGALLTPQMRRRFLREAQAGAGLDHPNVVPVYETGEIGSVCYLTSAYCDGPSLAAWLHERTEPVPVRTAATLAAVLAEAVHYTHQRGILHRDLKPGNVLLAPRPGGEEAAPPPGELEFVPRVTDFGLARLLEGSDETATGTVLGTPSYMAPEQADAGRGDVGLYTDVFALGGILYTLLTGRPAFRGGTDLDTLRQVLSAVPAPPRTLRADVPRDLEAVCLKCLEKEPRDRYESAAELAADLRRFLAGRPTRVRPPGAARRVLHWLRRRAVAAVVAASCVAVAGSLAFFLWSDASRRSTEEREGRQREHLRQHQDRERARRQQLYDVAVRAAWNAWERGEPVRARQLLDEQRPAAGAEDLRDFAWGHLRARCYPEAVVHGRRPLGRGLAVSPDGRLLACGCHEGTVVLLDLTRTETGWTVRPRMTLEDSALAVYSVAFAPDGKTLVSAGALPSNEGKVIRWDVATGKQLGAWTVSTGAVNRLAFAPDGRTLALATAMFRERGHGGVDLRDAVTGALTASFRDLGVNYAGVAFAPDGKTVAGTADGKEAVTAWDVATRRPRWHLTGRTGAADCVAFSPDGRTLAVGNPDGVVTVHESETGKERHALPGHTGGLAAVLFTPDSRTLISSGKDGTVRLWDLVAGCPLAELKAPTPVVDSLAVTRDGTTLILGGNASPAVYLWPLAAARVDQALRAHQLKGWALAYSPRERVLATGGDDLTVRLWNTDTNSVVRTFLGGLTTISCLAFSPDGTLFATGDYDRTVRVRETATGKMRHVLKGHPGPLRAVAFAPDGRTLASGGKDGGLRVWDVGTGQELARLDGHGKEPVRAVAFAPDGRTLVTAGQDGAINIWEVRTWARRPLVQEANEVWSVAFAPGGGTLAAGDKTGAVKIWDVAAGKVLRTLAGHTGGVRAVAFSPDGRTLATGGEDRAVRLWNPATGHELAVLREKQHITGLAFAPDGKELAVMLHDGTLRLLRAGY